MRENWQLWEGELSEEECNQIIALGLSKSLSEATISSSSNVYEVKQSFRNTQICWLNDSYIKKFHIALEKNLKRKIKVKLNIATIANTPLKTENEHKRNTKNRAINSLETDPSVKSLIRHFDATIIEESVQPKKNKGS